jgi:anti-sigma factor RsiW
MTEWHIPGPTLQAWVDGTASLGASASVEQHLAGCSRCRAAVAASAGLAPPATDPVWTAIRESIEAPKPSLVASALVRLGARDSEALLVTAAPALTGAWLGGLTAVLVFAVAAAVWTPVVGLGLFLVLAPLAPTAGVAAAYGGEADPTHELTLAAPYSKVRLLLLRTAIVVATCVPITMLAAVPLGGPWWVAVVWLIPAAAFVLVTLAAATYAPPVYAAAGVALTWVAVTFPVLLRRDPLALIDTAPLMAYAAIALVAGLVFVARLRHLATDWRIG